MPPKVLCYILLCMIIYMYGQNMYMYIYIHYILITHFVFSCFTPFNQDIYLLFSPSIQILSSLCQDLTGFLVVIEESSVTESPRLPSHPHPPPPPQLILFLFFPQAVLPFLLPQVMCSLPFLIYTCV